MIGTICVECQAQSPNLPLFPWTAYVNSPSSIRVRNVPKKIGSWCITRVYVSVVYPDGQIKTADCVPVGGVYVGTVAGAGVSGTTENGYVIMADGTDENGNAVTGYILGRGNVTILDDDGILKPDAKRYYVRMLSAESETHYEGDLYPTESGYVIWQNGQANLLGTPFEQITAYVENAVSAKADLSALEDYAKTDELSSKADLSAIPTNTSQLSNDSGFVTSSEMETSLELKQDKFSEDQLSAVDQSLYELQTKISFADQNPTIFFISPSYSLSKTILKEKGVLAEDGTTWLKEPYQIETGSNVSEIQAGLFQNATSLIRFTGKNITMIWGQAFSGCTALTKVEIPSIINLMGANNFSGCSSLTNLTLPRTLATVARMAFNNTSLQQVMFEGKTLAQVKAMANYSRWGLAEDKIYTNAYENQLPTKTSELSNDSGFIEQNGAAVIHDLTCDSLVANQAHIVGYATESDLSAKRDLSDMTVKGVPQSANRRSWFTIKYGTTIEYAWYYLDGRWETGQTLRVLSEQATIYTLQNRQPQETQWTNIGEFSLDSNYEATVTYDGVTYSITGYIGNLVTSNQLAALEARIDALEGNA